jgi:hypothetical protein
MKPIGHTDVRVDREHAISSSLEDAWSRYQSSLEEWSNHDIFSIGYLTKAEKALRGLTPSLVALNALALRDDAHPVMLGCFLTIGYQLAKETEITIDYDASHISYLGYRLVGKRLIFEGPTGLYAAEMMVGALVLGSSYSRQTGHGMIGTIDGGYEYYGEQEDVFLGSFGPSDAGEGMFGRRFGSWTVIRSERKQFLEEIMAPPAGDELLRAMKVRYAELHGRYVTGVLP